MTRTYSPKLVAYVSLAAVGLVASVALRLQELVVVVAPFALLPAVSLLFAREPRIDVSVELERERALEGDEVESHVTLDAERGAARLEVLLELPRGIGLGGGANPAAVWLGDDTKPTIDVGLHCERWGGYAVGRVFLRARDQFDFVGWEWTADRRSPLKVYPREESIRDLLRPLETQVYSGNHVARQRGEGIEFADLRLFVPGDRVRHVNWRATARRSELWVNQQQAERNADVLLFLDTFAEVTHGGESTLDLALRAAASLTARYVQQKDRVGFVTFGGMLNWLLPTTGAAQLYRLVDAMIDTQIVFNYAWRDIDVLPRRTLPPKAMVIALTPLLDERAVVALLDLRARGFDLVVVEISPEPFLDPPKGEVATLARRIWHLRREALRARFQEAGVPLAVWNDERSFAEGLEEVTTFRRRSRVVVA